MLSDFDTRGREGYDETYPETASDAWFFLEEAYKHLSKTHATKDAADQIDDVMVSLFKEMPRAEKTKVQKIYEHLR